MTAGGKGWSIENSLDSKKELRGWVSIMPGQLGEWRRGGNQLHLRGPPLKASRSGHPGPKTFESV